MNKHAAFFISAIAVASISVSCVKETPENQGNGPDPVVEAADTTKKIDESFGLYVGRGASLGKEGRICFYSAADNKLADWIDMADMATVTLREDGQLVPAEQMTATTKFTTMMDAIGPDGISYRRIVHCTPVRIVGDSLIVKPHMHKLAYATDYYITADASVVSGTSFKGVDKLYFRTCDKPDQKTDLTVAKTGKADFRTIQGAIDYAASLGSKEKTITVAAGTYAEMLYIRNNNKLTIKAAKGAKPEIAYANCEGWVNGSGSNVTTVPAIGAAIGKQGGRSVILIESCDMVTFQGLVMRNTFGSTAGQAEVIYNNDNSNKCRMIIRDCELWSYQDTFLTKGYVWVYNSLIAGHCDFIWGYPKACLFENCEIRALAKGYIVQCRCASEADKGFVFLNCKLTAADGVANGAMTLGRSAGQTGAFDNVTYVNCSMGSVIPASGWHTSPAPNPSKATATAGWKEYGSKDLNGNALTLTSRASCSKILTDEEVSPYQTRADVFASAPFTDSAWLN